MKKITLILLLIGVIIMARGHPDWWIQTGQFSFADIDTAELAVRIGSPITLHRSGRVIYLTGFEIDVNDWTFFSGGVGAEAMEWWGGDGGEAAKQPLRGSGAMKLTISDDDDDNGFYVNQAIKVLPAVWSGKLGIEMTFAIDDNVERIVLELSYDDGDTVVTGAIMIDAANSKLLYFDGDTEEDIADYTEFADMPGNTLQPPELVSLRWCNVKMILSSDLGEFTNFIFNGRSFADELAGVETLSASSSVTAFERLKIGIHAFGDDNSQGVLYVDDVILTQDEP